MMTASDVLHSCRSPPSTSPATRATPRPRHCRGWAWTARTLRRTPGLRFWRLLGTGRGETMTLSADLQALGAVRRLGGRGGARRVPRGLGRSRPAGARSAPRATRCGWTRCAPHGAWGGSDPIAAGRAARGRRGPGRDPHPREDPAAARIVRFYRAIEPPARDLGDAPGLLASVGIGEWPLARQATFSLWESLEAARAYAYGRAGAPRRGPPHARRGLVLGGAVRALPAVRRRGHLGRARPARCRFRAIPRVVSIEGAAHRLPEHERWRQT